MVGRLKELTSVTVCVCHIVLCFYPLRLIQPLVNISVNDMLESLLEKDLLVYIVLILKQEIKL